MIVRPTSFSNTGKRQSRSSPQSLAVAAGATLLAALTVASGGVRAASPAKSATAPAQAQSGSRPERGSHQTMLHSGISKSELGDVLDRIGIQCSLETEHQIFKIIAVRPGSSAYFNNLAVGDRIVELTADGNVFDITIERDGKIYRVQLKPLNGQSDATALSSQASGYRVLISAGRAAETKLFAGQAKSDLLKAGAAQSLLRASASSTGLKGETKSSLLVGHERTDQLSGDEKMGRLTASLDREKLTGKTSQPKLSTGASASRGDSEVKKLIPYHVELIIDRTGSMAWKDGTGELTKFQWCELKTMELAKALSPYVHDLTITVFNDSFETFRQVTPEKVHEIYLDYRPQGRTDLIDPLSSRIDEYFHTRTEKSKPLLLAVIHDGLPNVPANPDVVRQYLIRASKQMNRDGEVVVTFLQIGDNFDGQNFLTDLDENLVSEGARYDFVDTRTFQELKAKGLARALIDAITEARSGTTEERLATKKERKKQAVLRQYLPENQYQRLNDKSDEAKRSHDEREELERAILNGG